VDGDTNGRKKFKCTVLGRDPMLFSGFSKFFTLELSKYIRYVPKA
jgi:hypothetical protein